MYIVYSSEVSMKLTGSAHYGDIRVLLKGAFLESLLRAEFHQRVCLL